MTPLMRRSIALAAVTAAIGLAAAGGYFGGEARETGGDMASRFARPDAERAARTACASRSPFVVLDTFAHFRPVNIDDVGPAAADHGLQHGDIVAAIVEASHPGALAYQTNPIFSVRTLAADFGRLAADIEAKRVDKPAAIVSSIVLPVDLAEVNARRPGQKPFTSADVVSRRAELLDALTGGLQPDHPYTEIDRQIARLRAAGVPLFVAAGNSGPDETINALALSDGVFAVGALDRDGGRTAYTSAPGFVSVWSPGFVVLLEARGGVSVSGGRGVELKGVDLPEQKAVIARIAGRRAKDLVLDAPKALAALQGLGPSRQRDRYLAMTLEHGLYRTEDLMKAYGYSENLATFARAIAEGPYMHYPTDTIFQADADGVLSFDPLGDRSPGQLQVADATSYAAPNICAAKASAGAVASLAQRL